MNRRFLTLLIAIFLAIGVQALPELAQATPPFQDNPVEQCAEGVQLFLDDKDAEALPLLEAGFAGQESATFADPDDLGTCALTLGLLRRDVGDLSGALTANTVALEVFQSTNNRELEGTALNHIGLIYYRQGRYTQALETYQQALEIRRDANAGDRAGEGSTLTGIGAVYRAQGKYDQALAYYEQALEISREVGNRASEGTTLNHIGVVYQAQGRYFEALELFNQALKIARETGDRASKGQTLQNIGEVYRAEGHTDLALEFYQQALEIRRDAGDRAGEGSTLTGIGAVYYNQGKYDQALELYQNSLEISREVGNRAGEGTVIGHIGSVYQSQGNYERALDAYQQALEIAREVGARADEGTTLNNIGQLYSNQGQYELALEHFSQALEIASEVGNRAAEGVILNHIGEVYNSQARYEEALKLFQQALEIAREVGARADEGTMLNNIGQLYSNQERYAQALELFQRALEIAREVRARAAEGAILNNIGLVYQAQGRYEEALSFFLQALVIQREVGDRVSEISTLYNIGITYQQQGQLEQALGNYEQALNVLESVRAVAGSEAERASFIAQYADLCSRPIELYHQQGKETEAFFTGERCRARTFLDSLTTGYIQLSDDELQALLDQERETYTARQATQDALARARALNPPDTALVADLEAQLAEAEAAYTSAQAAIEARGDQLAALVPGRSSVSTLSEVQALLDEQTTLLSYYVLGDKGTLAFVITYDELTVTELPEATPDNLRMAVSDLHQWFNRDNPHPSRLQKLHAWLVAPLAEHLKTPQVGIIPHQILHYVPFAALTDGNSYFGEQHTLFVLPSASALDPIQKTVAKTSQAEKQPALVFGNPTTREGLSPLLGAADEARAVAELLGVPVYLGDEASEERLWLAASNAEVIHLAVHGATTNLLYNSALFLAAGDGDDSYSDGFLRVHEVYELDLTGTELVVFSNCETTESVISAGDDYVGLTRAFLFAGTPTVISSLWPVDDQATSELMVSFYRHWLDGMGKAEALQAAQAEVRANPKWDSPFYWSPFVLNGNPGVAPPSPSPLPLIIGLGGGLLLVLSSGFISLTRYSGLPAILLLRQGSSLIIVGSQYASYQRRWESGTPLEQLVVLLAPASECIDVDEFKGKLNQLDVPADVDQIGTALDTAVRNDLLLREAGGYRLAEPSLGRVLQAHQGVERQLALAEQLRHDHPLSINARTFFENAKFNVTPLDELLLYRCEPTSADLQRLLPAIVHARLLPEDPLDDKQVLAIQEQVKQVDADATVVFAITDQRPTDLGWAQIGTLRMSRFKLLPLSNSLINEGLRSGQERRLLRTEIEERLGGSYDPYDVRDPVAGAFSFFGRDALVSTLLRRLTEGRSVGIFGLRKLGKSSLLHALRDRALFPVAVINLEQFVGLQSDELSQLYQQILNEWAQRAQLQSGVLWTVPTIPTNAPSGAFVRATRELLECLDKVDGEARLGLFLDEIEVITVRPDNNGAELRSYLNLMRPLRSLVDTDGRLSLVVAGIDSSINRINAWGHQRNPTFSLFQEVNLPPLAEVDCKQMVSSLGRQIGLVYSDESLQAIWELSAGHPLLARQLCSLLYTLRDRTPGQIEEHEVRAGMERFIYDERTAYHLDRGLWQEASIAVLWGKEEAQVNQALLLDLARAETPVPIDDLINHPDANARRTALFNLEHFHIIYQPQPDTYAIRFGLLRTWLRRRKLGLE